MEKGSAAMQMQMQMQHRHQDTPAFGWKRVRLSASPATGLVGMEENSFLGWFFDCLGFLPLSSESLVRGAIMEVFLGFSPQTRTQAESESETAAEVKAKRPQSPSLTASPAEKKAGTETGAGGGDSYSSVGGQERPRVSDAASTCTFWCTVAMGALVQGQPPERVTPYMSLAWKSLSQCFDTVTAETARAFTMMAYLHNFLRNDHKFYRYLQFAKGVVNRLPNDTPEKQEIVDLLARANDTRIYHTAATEPGELDDYCKDNPQLKVPDVVSKSALCRLLLEADSGQGVEHREGAGRRGRGEGAKGNDARGGGGDDLAEISAKTAELSVSVNTMADEAAPSCPGAETTACAEKAWKVFSRLQDTAQIPEVGAGVGGLIYNAIFGYLHIVGGGSELEVGVAKIKQCAKVFVRYPGLSRFSTWLHLSHCLLSILAGLEDTGPFEELRNAYNCVRGKNELEAPPHAEWTMVGFCDHIFCRSIDHLAETDSGKTSIKHDSDAEAGGDAGEADQHLVEARDEDTHSTQSPHSHSMAVSVDQTLVLPKTEWSEDSRETSGVSTLQTVDLAPVAGLSGVGPIESCQSVLSIAGLGGVTARSGCLRGSGSTIPGTFGSIQAMHGQSVASIPTPTSLPRECYSTGAPVPSSSGLASQQQQFVVMEMPSQVTDATPRRQVCGEKVAYWGERRDGAVIVGGGDAGGDGKASVEQTHNLGVSMPLPTQEPGRTLKSRFATLARNSGASHKETRDHGRSLVGRRANLEEGRPYDKDGIGPPAGEGISPSLPLRRFQKAGRRVVRQCLERSLELAPHNNNQLGRLGSLELLDGDLESAVEHLRLAAKGSTDDAAWVALARAEVRLWEGDPAVGHEHLRCACDAYRRSIDLLEPGFVQVWELPVRLLELGGVYESFGSFEGALYIYQRIASSMPLSTGFEDVLFRCAVVMRYMSTLERAPRESLLQSALEHLDLILQEQTVRKGHSVQVAWLLYADVCMSLGESSAVAKAWAKGAYQEVFHNRQKRGDTHAMAFGDWDDWIASPETQLQFAKEWSERGEPALAILAFEKSIKAFEMENEISPGSTAGAPFDALMDASEALASFQRFSRAEELVRMALELEPENEEAKNLLREFLGDENCRRKEMLLQVVLHLQSKWRTRVWQGQYLLSLKKRLQINLEERLATNRLDVEAREQLAYFFRDKHRPVLLFEDRCARTIQRLGRAGLFRLRWFAVKQRAYRKELTNALKLWQKCGYTLESREIIRRRAASRYTPATHKIVSVVDLMRRQDEAAPVIQRAARRFLARKMFTKILKNRARDLRRKRKAAAVHVQCQMRCYLARRELDRRVALATERTRAATFIQHTFRARALQWGYAIARAQRARERAMVKTRLRASVKLQASWRMKLGRNVANRRRRAAVVIQRSSRRFLGRKRAEARKNELVTRIQRQYRRHKERLVILRALMAMRVSREMREARAKEVERRFRALEEERLRGGAGGRDVDISTPLEARRVARANQRLLKRMQAKTSSILRARKWRLQRQPSKSPCLIEATTSSSIPAQTSLLLPSSPGPSASISPATLSACGEDNDSSCGRPPQNPETEDARHDMDMDIAADGSGRAVHGIQPPPGTAATPTPAEVPCQQHRLPGFAPVTTPGPSADELVPTGIRPATLLEHEPSTFSCDYAESSSVGSTQESSQARPGPALLTSTRRSSPTQNGNDCFETSTSPPPPSSAVAAALTCAHGIGGRLGTPLGSPYPAPGEDWVTGRSASASARAAAARTAKRFGGDVKFETSAPGSRFFPPFFSASSAGTPGQSVSPVVFEMVQDAAEDEDDVVAEAAAAALVVAGNVVAECGAGWHGLMLYRPPGVSRKSQVFQQALQMATVAFSPDVRHPSLPAPPARFDSADMIMTAGLLDHPESSLKRLVLHRARIDTGAGREAFLRCLAINKLDCLALGACTWFSNAADAVKAAAEPQDARRKEKELQSGRWWKKVFDTIRMNSFRLQELVVEGLDEGGDALGNALGVTLDDHFVKRFGHLASIVVARCKLSDEGATAIATGIYASNTLTHVDLSANTISDVGVEALAKVLVGEHPGEQGDNGDQDGKAEEGEQSAIQRQDGWSGRKSPVLKTLDLGQNRIMDPGGLALAAVLARSTSLESLTVSYNFMMEDAAQALLDGAAASGATLRNIHCEGNLFDDNICRRIAHTLKHRRATRPSTLHKQPRYSAPLGMPGFSDNGSTALGINTFLQTTNMGTNYAEVTAMGGNQERSVSVFTSGVHFGTCLQELLNDFNVPRMSSGVEIPVASGLGVLIGLLRLLLSLHLALLG
eukprot:g4616.t1